MTPVQIEIIKLTFLQVAERSEETGRLFYERLFAIAPDTRQLFKDDIDAQARKLMDSLATAISSLRNTPALMELLEGLGRRHAGYGVSDAHYGKVGEALLWTLEKVLKDAFTPPVKEAWAGLYGAVADTMKKAAAGAGRTAA